MAFTNDAAFEDDFRKVGHDATASFEHPGAPDDPTAHAGSEHVELAAEADEDDLEDDDELEDDDDELEDEDELDDEDEDDELEDDEDEDLDEDDDDEDEDLDDEDDEDEEDEDNSDEDTAVMARNTSAAAVARRS